MLYRSQFAPCITLCLSLSSGQVIQSKGSVFATLHIIRNLLRWLLKMVRNKLECLYLAGFFCLAYCLQLRPGVYPSLSWSKAFRCFFWVSSDLTLKLQTSLEIFARYKHSCLLRTFVNYGCKKFNNVGTSVSIRKTKFPSLHMNGCNKLVCYIIYTCLSQIV